MFLKNGKIVPDFPFCQLLMPSCQLLMPFLSASDAFSVNIYIQKITLCRFSYITGREKMKNETIPKTDTKILRILKYLTGLWLITLGVSIAVRSDLGTAPISCIPYTLTLTTGLEMGLGTMLFQIFLVIVQILILRRDFPPAHLLEIVISILFGFMQTFSNTVTGSVMDQLAFILPVSETLAFRLLMSLMSAFIIACGLCLYLPAQIMPMPADGLVQVIAQKTGRLFSWVKVCFDCTVVTISGIVCLTVLHSFGSIGIGTVIAALMVGTFHRMIRKALDI